MATLVECILPVAIDWMTWEYSGLVPPAEWGAVSTSLLPNNFLFVPAGIAGESAQDCGYDEYTLAYCPRDGNIYLGETQLWNDYNDHGDADIWGTISHEMGHRVQHLAGMRVAVTANETIPTENQADCFSGAFMGYAARNRYMDPVGPDTVSDDDVADMIVGLLDIGESEGPERTHGTDDQRVRALYIGYNSPANLGVFACDFYLSDISIVPASAG
jgi:predicted metalloprotease